MEIDVRDEDFQSVLICAERYACGRRTYMPSVVAGFIKALIPELSDKTLYVLKRDIEGCENLGDPRIDAPVWESLLSALCSELEQRE